MNIEKKLKNRLGKSAEKESAQPFGADIELHFSIDFESSETKIVNFHDEITKIKNKYEESKEIPIENIELVFKKKRKKKISSKINGQDDFYDDDFIDDSEAFEVFIPKNWTTSVGGFFVNKGPLKYIKTAEEKTESILSQGLSQMAQTPILSQKAESTKNNKKKSKSNSENAQPDLSQKKSDLIPDSLSQTTNALTEISCNDNEIVKQVEILKEKNWNIIKDIDENDFVKETFSKIALRLMDNSKKDRMPIYKYIGNKLNLSLNNTQKYVKQAETFILNNKIAEILATLKTDFKDETEKIIKDPAYLVNYTNTHIPLFERIIKYRKRLTVISNSKDTNEKIISDVVTEYITPLLPSDAIKEPFLQFLQLTFFKSKKSIPKLAETQPSPAKIIHESSSLLVENKKEVKEIAQISPPMQEKQTLSQHSQPSQPSQQSIHAYMNKQRTPAPALQNMGSPKFQRFVLSPLRVNSSLQRPVTHQMMVNYGSPTRIIYENQQFINSPNMVAYDPNYHQRFVNIQNIQLQNHHQNLTRYATPNDDPRKNIPVTHINYPSTTNNPLTKQQ